MISPRRELPVVEFEVVGVAVAGALVAGGLALVDPFLASLSGALAALALAGWVAQISGAGTRSVRRMGRSGAAALTSLSVGAVIFLASPSALTRVRGLLLAVSLVPLWMAARHTPVGVP